MKICVVLTQYKRNYLDFQLKQIQKQSLKPDFLVVFQNENHVDISNLKNKYKFIHIKNDYNTKYFGRFSFCFNIPADIFLVLDDDIIPGKNCFKNYVDQCTSLNSIIGGNGRYGYFNKNTNKFPKLEDVGIRKLTKVDFVGHLWCFKKEWLHYMFAIKPYTYNTGEDMHFCYSSKLLGNINSYQAGHKNKEECSDISMNKFATDKFASFRKTNTNNDRQSIEKYFIDKGLKLIENI